MKKTIILGASTKPERYSYKAFKSLREHGHEVVAFGAREDELEGEKIHKELFDVKEVDTVTLYLNPKRQVDFYDFILKTKPKRIVFNPGTENEELMELAKENGIHCEVACTLVLLSLGSY
jgi:predicted CoA-binding protein